MKTVSYDLSHDEVLRAVVEYVRRNENDESVGHLLDLNNSTMFDWDDDKKMYVLMIDGELLDNNVT